MTASLIFRLRFLKFSFSSLFFLLRQGLQHFLNALGAAIGLDMGCLQELADAACFCTGFAHPRVLPAQQSIQAIVGQLCDFTCFYQVGEQATADNSSPQNQTGSQLVRKLIAEQVQGVLEDFHLHVAAHAMD